MKLFATLLFSLTTLLATAQITITDADMPLVDDTFRVSNAFDFGIDYSLTGPNVTWDYTNLTPNSQDVDTMFAVAETNTAYQIFFDNWIIWPNHQANYGTRGQDFDLMGQLTIEDVFDFWKYDATSFRKVGYGAFINGIPTPVRYDDIEEIYAFPMNYGNVDSGTFAFDLTIPTLGYYGGWGERRNEVDGWGTLMTPYGTFQSLRVRSEIDQTDTLYVDLLGFGFNIPRPTTIEYKWFGQGSGIPLLQITTQDFFGTETVQSIVYQDSIRAIVGIEEQLFGELKIWPNPATNLVHISADRGLNETNPELIDITGKAIELVIVSREQNQVTFDVSTLATGMYFIRDKETSAFLGKLVRE